MLEDAITRRSITELTFEKEFRERRARLSPQEDAAIVAEIQRQLDAVPVGEPSAAGWIAPGEWADTPFMPIYVTVGKHDHVASAFFLGNFFRRVVIDRPELWRCVKQPKKPSEPDGVEFTLYWRAS